MEYYSAVKRNEVLTCDTTWMNLENILSQRERSTKTTCYMTALTRNVQSRKSIDTESGLVVAMGLRRGGRKRRVTEWVGISFWGDENVLQLDCSEGSISLCEYTGNP